MMIKFKPKIIFTTFGCDVHLKDKLIEKSSYDNLDYEVLNLRLMNEEVNLTAEEASELLNYIMEWLDSSTKNTDKEKGNGGGE